jgi:exonuclease III
VVHRSVVGSVVKKIVCNDRIIDLKLKVELADILIMEVYVPTSEYEDDEVEKLYDTIEEILEEDGKGDTNSIILGDWKSIVGDESYWNIVGSHGLETQNHRSLTSVKEMDCHHHLFQEAKEKTVHMEGTWRLESTSAALHPCEALIQKECEGCAETAWGRY